MRNIIFFISLLISIFSLSAKGTTTGCIIKKDTVTIYLDCIDDGIIHVKVIPEGRQLKKSLIVPDSFSLNPVFEIEEKKEWTQLKTALITVKYYHEKDVIEFSDNNTGNIILSEATRTQTSALIGNEDVVQISQTFRLKEDEAIYGLGQYQDGYMNYRGKSIKLLQANMEIANPFLLSTENYGILWDNYSKTLFNDNEEGATFWSEVADGINYYFIYGKSIDEIISQYHQMTGKVPMLRKSAFGFWQSKERYKSFKELTDVVAEYRNRKIPIDNIVQDWEYWGEQPFWNSMKFDDTNFPNPEKAIADLHDKYNVQFMISVWPGVGQQTDIYKELKSINALFNEETWANYKVVDIYNPEAQKIFWKHLHNGLYSKGVDGWWMDATEPSFREGFTQDRQEEITKSAGKTFLGSFHRYLSVYSLFQSKMMYHNLRKESNNRVSILTRSAFAGQQQYSTVIWSGDVSATWDVYKKQIPAGLNFCMTGIPYWTSDIGGFFVTTRGGDYPKGLDDPAYKELYVRWFQYGAFSPLFRAHGSNVPREIWQFGKPGEIFYDAQLEMINIRYRLLSYIYSSAWQVTANSKIMMRGLVMDFPEDKNVRNNAKSYMFGSSLLVQPVTQPMYYDKNGKINNPQTEIPVYLPQHKGRYWYDFYTGKRYEGGRTIGYEATMNKIPVFVKAGSIIPYNNIVQYTGEKKDEELEIVIYSGANAEFDLYEDDETSYDYENGHYSIIRFKWDDQKKSLSIVDKEGKHTYLDTRIFNVKVNLPEGRYEKVINYNNTAQSITF